MKYGLQAQNSGQYLTSDIEMIQTDKSLWTDDPCKAQVFYDQENAFRCAGIVSSVLDADIEVVTLDG